MRQVGFTGSPLDRAEALRHDPAALAAAAVDPRARLLRLAALEPEVTPGGALVWDAMAALPPGSVPVLLGLEDGAPRFAAYRPGEQVPRGRPPSLNATLDALSAGDAETYAIARGVLDWHARHGFCANCGTATLIERGGWARRCPGCGAEHFPRTDPVVIMLAEHGGRVLVGRQASWPAGRYSALAGFVEVGESVEEAVARELMEEAGVRVGAVRYLASQPWPFPSQLMIACIAQADDDALTVDANELEAAMWVTRDQVRAALAGEGPFLVPPPYAIAHTLLEIWAAG